MADEPRRTGLRPGPLFRLDIPVSPAQFFAYSRLAGDERRAVRQELARVLDGVLAHAAALALVQRLAASAGHV